MADIDMIPRSYRDGLRVRAVLRRAAIALAVVVLAAAAGSVTLRWRTVAIDRDTAALRTQAAQAQSAQARDATLRDKLDRRAQDASLLRTLRRQGELAAFAQAIDATLPHDAWLTSILLRRDVLASSAGTPPPETPTTPQAAPGTTIDLAGEAASYDAVSTFLARLGRAPGIAHVRLASSGTTADAHTIGFRAAVELAWQEAP